MTDIAKIAAGKSRERITIGDREYRRFITYPTVIRDGTYRCIACGQIDDDPHHDMEICLAVRDYLREQNDG